MPPELSEEVVVAPSGLFFNDVTAGLVKVYGVCGDEKTQLWNDAPPTESEQSAMGEYE